MGAPGGAETHKHDAIDGDENKLVAVKLWVSRAGGATFWGGAGL